MGLNLFGNPALKFSTMEHLGRDIGTPTDEPFVFLAIPSALVARNTRWTEEFTSLEASKEAYFCGQGVGAHESTPTVTVLYTDTVDQKWNLINKIHIFLRLVAP